MSQSCRHLAHALLLGLVLALSFLPGPAFAQANPDIAPNAYDYFWVTASYALQAHPPSTHGLAFDSAAPGLALSSEDSVLTHMWRSTDHGLTWNMLPSWQADDRRWAYKVAYGAAPRTFYAFGGGSVYKTVDAGDTWTNLGYEESNCNVLISFAAHPVTPTILFAGTTSGLARSLDGGQTWDTTPPMPGYPGACSNDVYASSIAIRVDQPNVIYVGQNWYSGGVLKSTDLGETWQPVNTGLPEGPEFYDRLVKQVIVDPTNAGVAYALMGRSNQVYRTTDGGGQWQLVNQGAEGVLFDALVFDAPAAGSLSRGLYGLVRDRVYYLPGGTPAWQLVRARPLQNTGGSIAGGITVDPFVPGQVVAYNLQGVSLLLPLRGSALLPILRR